MAPKETLSLLLLMAFLGCAMDKIPTPAGAEAVVRHTNWKKWNRFQPEQTLQFGQWIVQAPDQSTSRTKSDVTIGPYERGKQRMGSTLNFHLENSGTQVASVTAEAKYKISSTSAVVIPGRISKDEHDSLYGRIDIAGYSPAEFTVQGFSSDSIGAQAFGSLTVGPYQIELREIDAPWYDNRDGFAGAEFILQGRQVGHVVRGNSAMIGGGNPESVWIAKDVPQDVNTAIAATSAALLLATRMEPAPPNAD